MRAAVAASSSSTPPPVSTPTSSSYGARPPSPNARAVATTSAPSRPGQAGVAQRVAGGAGPVVPVGVGQRPRAPGQDLVGDGGQQRLLVGEVVVERAGLHPELGAEPAHREVGQPVVVEDAQGPGDDVLAAVAHVILPRRPR